jgi:hypothetical protein
VKNVKKKVLMLTVVATIAVLLTSSLIAISQGWFQPKPKPEYVPYDLKMVGNGAYVWTLTDASGYPIIITEGYPAENEIIEANVTINGVLYKYPDDIGINWTIHSETNALTGNGWARIVTTYIFKNLHGHPTLTEWAVNQFTGSAPPYTSLHYWGDFKLTGTKMFSKVEGFGMGDLTIATGVRSSGWIKGWPL